MKKPRNEELLVNWIMDESGLGNSNTISKTQMHRKYFRRYSYPQFKIWYDDAIDEVYHLFFETYTSEEICELLSSSEELKSLMEQDTTTIEEEEVTEFEIDHTEYGENTNEV